MNEQKNYVKDSEVIKLLKNSAKKDGFILLTKCNIEITI